jgi:N-acetylglucosamine-6-phosphate deacetylase
MTRALVNGRVFDGQQLQTGLTVILEGGKVSAMLPHSNIPASVTEHHDLKGRILAPGLVDIQVNGGGGLMFNDAPTLDTIRVMAAAHRRYGTTGFLPTLISTDSETMERAIDAVRQAIAQSVPGVLGIHLEGPHLSPEKRGIHHAERFCPIDETAFRLLTSLKAARTLVTLAPESSNLKTISRLAGQGVIVFGGHSDATYEQTVEALGAGMRGFTHLFNAMSPLQSRAPGMVGAALQDRESWCGLIADGAHVHPATFDVAVKAKRKGYSILVTDAMASVGSDQKSFTFDGLDIDVSNGSCRLASGALAGSDLDMITAVRNAARFAGLSPFEALRMASTYPAHALGLEKQLGYIRVGYKASFIEIDDDLKLFGSWVDGVRSGD